MQVYRAGGTKTVFPDEKCDKIRAPAVPGLPALRTFFADKFS